MVEIGSVSMMAGESRFHSALPLLVFVLDCTDEAFFVLTGSNHPDHNHELYYGDQVELKRLALFIISLMNYLAPSSRKHLSEEPSVPQMK